jgi:hypothetical protein
MLEAHRKQRIGAAEGRLGTANAHRTYAFKVGSGVRRFAEAGGGEMTLSESTPGWYSHQPGRGLIEIISKRIFCRPRTTPVPGTPLLTTGLALNPINPTFDGMFAPLTILWIGSLEDGRSICL